MHEDNKVVISTKIRNLIPETVFGDVATMGETIHFFSVGNPLYGDDGVGRAVLEVLKKSNDYPTAAYFDGQTDALSLIDRFEINGINIIIDAARMGKPPGTVEVIEKEDITGKIRWDHLSVHGFGLAETLSLARKINTLPKKLWVIGIEPEIIQIDEPISEKVIAAIPVAVQKIKHEVFENGTR